MGAVRTEKQTLTVLEVTMKLTYLTWGYAHDGAVIRAFEEAGLVVDTVAVAFSACFRTGDKEALNRESADIMENTDGENEGQNSMLRDLIRTSAGDIVFSVNFSAAVSKLCMEEAIPYCCWVLQLPNFDLYREAVLNPCNYVGICDSFLTEKLWQAGMKKAFFLPDAVGINMTPEGGFSERGIALMERQPVTVLSTEGMSLYGKGYLDAFLRAQSVLYGGYILENGLIRRVREEFLSANSVPGGILPGFRQLFAADRYLAPACTILRQENFLRKFPLFVTAYPEAVRSTNAGSDIAGIADPETGSLNAVGAGTAVPAPMGETFRREFYARKEFTLVLAPHTLHNGIPREALEVISAGGFPLCGFQKDYACFFRRDENLAYFTDLTDFQLTVSRYWNDHDERERVREAAYRAVAEGHTYGCRIRVMLEMWEAL